MLHRLALTALVGLILAAGLGLRLAGLDRLVTPDEPLWITRSARFAAALTDGRLADTYQAVHPGVTLMWVGTAVLLLRDPSVPSTVPGPAELTRVGEVDTVLEPLGFEMAPLLVDLRAGAILLNALILAMAWWLLWKALGAVPALVAGALITFDPLYVGTSRLLHLDALTAGLLLVSPLALLAYLQSRSSAYLALSAATAALAWLTRTSGLVLLPWTAAILALSLARSWRCPSAERLIAARRVALAGATWLAIALLTTAVCWPALWVAPIGTIEAGIQGSLDLATEAHAKQIFFRGAVRQDDPGLLFYPVAFVWRTSPIVLIGLGLALGGALAPTGAGLDRRTRLAVGYLVAFALAYLVLLNVGAKKIDRYALPVLIVADVVAAIGWVWLAGRAVDRGRRRYGSTLSGASAACLLVAAVTMQAGFAVASAPYFFHYYNPLVGGLDGAEDVMMIGWGEGFDQVGDWLNAQPNAEQLAVTAGPWPKALDYYFVGSVAQREHLDLAVGQAREWLTTDIAVVSFAEVQRRLVGAAFWEALRQAPPTSVVRLDGEEMIWVYDLRGRPMPEIVYRTSPLAFAWEPGDRLLDVTTGNRDFRAGTTLGVTLWLALAAPSDRDVTFRATIVHEQTAERYTVELTPAATSDAKGVTLAEGRIKTPVEATPGAYVVCVSAVDPTTGAVRTGAAPGAAARADEVCGGQVILQPADGTTVSPGGDSGVPGSGQDEREPAPDSGVRLIPPLDRPPMVALRGAAASRSVRGGQDRSCGPVRSASCLAQRAVSQSGMVASGRFSSRG
jgi:hypothetical protein